MYRFWVYCIAQDALQPEAYLDAYSTVEILDIGRAALFVEEITRWTRVMTAERDGDDVLSPSSRHRHEQLTPLTRYSFCFSRRQPRVHVRAWRDHGTL